MLGTQADVRVAKRNLGLAQSITKGVGELVAIHGRVIVVEDDLELAPGFLKFMNAALDRYENAENVFQISGHMFDVPEFVGRNDAIFLPLTTTWGWATWARSWQAYDPTASGWKRLLVDRALRRRFNLNESYDYVRLMKLQALGRSDSWGIRWYWSVFQRDGLCLFPPQSLVRNTGQDGSGTHGRGFLANFSAMGGDLSQSVITLPEEIAVSRGDLVEVRKAIWRQRGGWLGWAKAKIQSLLRR
jgi:hypothetical protein